MLPVEAVSPAERDLGFEGSGVQAFEVRRRTATPRAWATRRATATPSSRPGAPCETPASLQAFSVEDCGVLAAQADGNSTGVGNPKGYCYAEQPPWSAVRDPSFGHGVLDVLNATHALWQCAPCTRAYGAGACRVHGSGATACWTCSMPRMHSGNVYLLSIGLCAFLGSGAC